MSRYCSGKLDNVEKKICTQAAIDLQKSKPPNKISQRDHPVSIRMDENQFKNIRDNFENMKISNKPKATVCEHCNNPILK